MLVSRAMAFAISHTPRRTLFGAAAFITGAIAALPAHADWLKTFSAREIEDGATILSAPAYETTLEQDVRRALEDGLARRGFAVDGEDEASRYALTFDVRVLNEHEAQRAKSPVRIVPSSWRFSTPHDTQRQRHKAENDNRVEVDIFDPSPPPAGPSVRMTVMLLDRGERIWAGHAAGAIAGATRMEVARTMAHALLERLGETVALDEISFAASASAGRAALVEPL